MLEAVEEIAQKASVVRAAVDAILQNHVVVHLKQRTADMASLLLFEDMFSALAIAAKSLPKTFSVACAAKEFLRNSPMPP